MVFRQGDTYSIPISVKDSSGTILDHDLVDVAEFSFGNLQPKYYRDDGSGDVTVNESEAFLVNFTQEETVAMELGTLKYQVRVKFKAGGIVRGSGVKDADVVESLSKEVL